MRPTDRFGPLQLDMRRVMAAWLRFMRASGALRGLHYVASRPRLVYAMLLFVVVCVVYGVANDPRLW